MNEKVNKFKCNICGFKAKLEYDLQKHIALSKDRAHKELLKENAKKKMNDIKDEVKDSWNDVKEKSGNFLSWEVK